jgi:hypothetical protein
MKKSRIDPELEALVPYLRSGNSLGNLVLNRMATASESLHQIRVLLRQAVHAQAAAIAAEMVLAERKRDGREKAVKVESCLPPRPALPGDVGLLDPFFRSRGESNAIRREQRVSHRARWALYYDQFGCLVCGTKSVPHSSNGMCAKCHTRTTTRLTKIDRLVS